MENAAAAVIDAAPRRMSERGRVWLAVIEGGSSLRPYQRRAVTTIGPGLTTLIQGGRFRRATLLDRFPSQAAALAQFALQLERVEALCDAALREDATQAEFDAFVALAWNQEPAVKSSTRLTRLFNQRAPVRLVVAALREYCREGDHVIADLVERRDCEADLILYGVYRARKEAVA